MTKIVVNNEVEFVMLQVLALKANKKPSQFLENLLRELYSKKIKG